MFMFPSSDDIFDILIKIQLQSGLYEEYSIDPSFQADISFEYIFIFKYRSYGNAVFVKWNGHTENCQYASCDGGICASKSKIPLYFCRKYMTEQLYAMVLYESDRCFDPWMFEKISKHIYFITDIFDC